MRTAYICCPLGGEVKANLEKAKKYAKYTFECGMAPVAFFGRFRPLFLGITYVPMGIALRIIRRDRWILIEH